MEVLFGLFGEKMNRYAQIAARVAAFTERWGGSDVEVSDKLLKLLDSMFGKPSFVEPMVKGRDRWCQENARQEYWARKEAGQNPVYVEGMMLGIDHTLLLKIAREVGTEPDRGDIEKLGFTWTHHVWVEVGGKICDPTPIQVDGSPWRLRKASDVWFAEYKPRHRINSKNDHVLKDELDMPGEAIERLGRIAGEGLESEFPIVTLYHGSFLSNMESIKANGIVPRACGGR